MSPQDRKEEMIKVIEKIRDLMTWMFIKTVFVGLPILVKDVETKRFLMMTIALTSEIGRESHYGHITQFLLLVLSTAGCFLLHSVLVLKFPVVISCFYNAVIVHIFSSIIFPVIDLYMCSWRYYKVDTMERIEPYQRDNRTLRRSRTAR
ncbi:unknown protein [Simkania negevensis Z]|uniref:Uncharacterized protein n=1 Tax=Simkania negevensis (strain ATCC VR-1471 / DSM 27360 / Z) TaxID=331113 RepID=F8L9Q9_SIMNZ|nr:unknown protein [Simkania negevensis Z]